MNVIKSILLLCLLLGTFLGFLNAQEEGAEGSKQFIDHPDKNEYLLAQPGTDKHKYGYELKENQHFHHTTTELDGVRLGCYGYVLNGKKYSTQYVADNKGYRPVYTYDVIEVFPKSGGVREASFIRNFNEDEDKSGNIRYFFPEGCRGFDSEISPENNPMTPIIMKNKIPLNPNIPGKIPVISNAGKTPLLNTGTPVRPPPSFPSTPQQKPTPKTPSKPNRPAEKYLPPSQNQPTPPSKYLPPGQTQQQPIAGKYVTKSPVKASQVALKPKPITPQNIPKVSQLPITQNRIPSNPSSSASSKNGGCPGCCADEESLPKIVIPIKLKNAKSESCPSYAKLIVPADSVNVNNLRSNPNELAKMVLSSLQ